MYSVVLMAALTTSVDLPDRRGGCGGGGGCMGGCMGGRSGRGGRGGRHGGGGCCGCSGGGGYGGCMGMGYGGGYGGCMGMGYGGGYGGCMGMGYGGGHGGCMGMGMGMGGGCYGGGMMMQSGTILQQGATKSGEQIKTKPVEKESLLPAPATIVVELPADAKLFIDNEATTSIGGSRVFQSPVLNTGKEFHYTLKAEVIRDGKPVKAEKVVAVKAGQITPVTLTLPPAGVAQR